MMHLNYHEAPGGQSFNLSHTSKTHKLVFIFLQYDNDNENTLFDHNIQIEITIYKQFR